MRILHTSDWHLGRPLEGRSRQREQEAFIDELCGIVEDEKIDLILIAGDVFDTVNPTAYAEELYYDALDRLAAGGQRGVVVIAGNHDNPERLRAVEPLAARQGIALFGIPSDSPAMSRHKQKNKVRIVNGGPSWVEMAVPGFDYAAVIAALPYPSEARLKEILTASLAEEEQQAAYSQKIGLLMAQLAQNFRTDSINLAMSHLFVLGGSTSESERPIQVGSGFMVEAAHLSAVPQYTALGHLHRPQKVGGAPTQVRYSGSPLAYSFSEAGQTKSVVIVEVSPGEEAVVNTLNLSSGNPLVKWQAKAGLSEVWQWIEQGVDNSAWIDLEIHVGQPLSNEEIHRLRQLRPNIINIRPILPGMDEELVMESRAQLSEDELFRRFYARQKGHAAPPELVNLFMELLVHSDGSSPDSCNEVHLEIAAASVLDGEVEK